MSIEYEKFRSRGNTLKLASTNGYIYTKRNEYRGAEYWKCDRRNVCNATVVLKNGQWVKGSPSAWELDNHRTHLPDIER